MATTETAERSDLGAIGGILRRRLWLVVVAVIAGIGFSILFSKSQPTKYQATATLLYRSVYLDVQLTGVPLQIGSGDPTRDLATNMGLISEEDVRAEAAQQLGPPYTADSLKPTVSVSEQGKTDLVGVQATAGTPTEAARIANAVAGSYLRITNQQIVSEITAAQARVRSQINVRGLRPSQRQALTAALTKLSVLSSLGAENVHLVQPAVPPTSPSSPKTTRNAIIGGLAGLVIGLALAFGAEQFDRRLRRPEEVEAETGLPLLASIPKSRTLRRPLGPSGTIAASDSEPFRQLASTLRHLSRDRAIRSVLVTSPGPGSGKTTVALHLAAAAAAGMRSKVFLVEADLRRPRLATLLGLGSERGLSTVLESAGPDASESLPGLSAVAVQKVELETGAVAVAAQNGHNGHRTNGHETLSVLLAGPRSENATGLLESSAMRELIGLWRSTYELTVVDSPPPGFVADAIPLAKQVDAVILVARMGKDTGSDLRRLRVELERLGIEPIGVVANFGRRNKNPYTASRR